MVASVGRHLLRVLLLLGLLSSTTSAMAQSQEPDPEIFRRVLAAYLYQILFYVEWPEDDAEHATGPFEIWILGDDDFEGEELSAIEARTIQGRELVVRRGVDLKREGTCHLFYIDDSETERTQEILSELRGQNVLTVSEIESFATMGGIIELMIVDDRLGFDINTSAAKREGLSINSQLLKVAREVLEDHDG